MHRRTALGILTMAILPGCLQLEQEGPESSQSQDGDGNSVPNSAEANGGTPDSGSGSTAEETPEGSGTQQQSSSGWPFESESPLSGPALGTDRVYIGSLEQTLYAVDTESGEADWKIESSEFESSGYEFCTPLLADNYVYANSNREVLKIERSSGEVVGRFDSGFVTGNSELIITSGGPGTGITVYKPTDNRPIWQSNVQPLGRTHEPVLGDGIVVFGSVSDYVDAPDADRNKDTRVFALDRGTGEKLWDFTPNKFVGRSIGVAFATSDGTVAIADEEGTIFAVDATDGSVLWEQEIERRGSGSLAPQPTTIGDLFLFATGDVYGVDAESGDIRWTTSTESINVTNPLPVTNDTVWIPTGDYFEPSNLIQVNTGGEVQSTYEFSTGYEKLPVIGDENFYISHTDQTLRKYNI